jgi:hypothetical protein
VGVRIGPWVATSDEAATTLLATILAGDAPWRTGLRDDDDAEPQVFVSISGANTHATRLFESLGGALEEDDLIMRLDLTASEDAPPRLDTQLDHDAPPTTQLSAPLAAHPDWLYGWIAPMVF